MVERRKEPHVETLSPSECSDSQLAHFKRLVLSGGEVTAEGLDERIRIAEKLGFVFNDSGTLVGVGAIKKPNPNYRNGLFKKARISLNYDHYELELGWIAVTPEFQGRGYSKALVKGLIECVGSTHIYATTSKDNQRMQSVLFRFGFDISGNEFHSNLHPQHRLLLLTRPPLDSRSSGTSSTDGPQ